MKVGLKVGWAGEGPAPQGPGAVESWEIDETGDVIAITVAWADGRRESIGALEGLLRRL